MVRSDTVKSIETGKREWKGSLDLSLDMRTQSGLPTNSRDGSLTS